jgi:type III secretion protein HrpB1
MSNNQCSPAVLKVLLSVFYGGVTINARSDSEDLLLALRTLVGPGPFIELCDARMRIRGGEWAEASRILLQLNEQGDGSPVVWALRALCLKMLGDDEWRRCVEVVIESDDDTSIALVARFLNVHESELETNVSDFTTRIAETMRLSSHA